MTDNIAGSIFENQKEEPQDTIEVHGNKVGFNEILEVENLLLQDETIIENFSNLFRILSLSPKSGAALIRIMIMSFYIGHEKGKEELTEERC